MRTKAGTIIAALLVGLTGFTGAQGAVLAQWVQVGADGAATVRAISDGECPQVVFDGKQARNDDDRGVARPEQTPGNVPRWRCSR